MFKGQSCLQISGHILDEFLTEIENLIKCQVLFSSLNQETVLEDFWFEKKGRWPTMQNYFTDGHCNLQIMYKVVR